MSRSWVRAASVKKFEEPGKPPGSVSFANYLGSFIHSVLPGCFLPNFQWFIYISKKCANIINELR